ncbi:hypothetical protein D4R86_02165 [bacterium]|nr:MAG: hypothetical protein D4R86_02165 [bacterium]
MPLPDIFLNTQFMQFNLTAFLSVMAICLTAMGTIIRIWGRSAPKSDELPGNTPLCTQHKESVNINREAVKEVQKDIQELKTKMATMRIEIDTSNKTTNELKADYKTLSLKLDELLRQLLDMLI